MNARLGNAQTTLVKKKQGWEKEVNTTGVPSKVPSYKLPVDGLEKNGYNNGRINNFLPNSTGGSSGTIINESDQSTDNRANWAKIKQSDEKMVQKAEMEAAKTSRKSSDGKKVTPTPKQTPSIEHNPAPRPEPPRPEVSYESEFFDTMDDAAHAFLLKYQGQSQKEGREYGAVHTL